MKKESITASRFWPNCAAHPSRTRISTSATSLKRLRFTGTGIPIINLKVFNDRLRFMMGIPIPIDSSRKSRNASHKYPTMYHFVTEMYTHLHISVTR